MSPYNIVLADDHILFCEGIKRIIKENSDMEVMGEAHDGLQLLELLKRITPDLVILGISLPNIQGIEATQKIKASHPDIKVLILTMHKEKDYLYLAILAGADGYLLKEDSDIELFSAINAIREGRAYISPLLTGHLTGDLQQMYNGKKPLHANNLTTREREVLKLIAEGNSNRQVADLLFISIRTVENHRAKIMKKLNLKSTTELVKYTIQKGITSAAP